jgi:hypothetical protein
MDQIQATYEAAVYEKKGTAARNRQRGGMVQPISLTSEDGTAVYLTSRQDTRPVDMLSTMQSDLGTCRQKAKVNGAWKVVDFPRPGVIGQYKKGEGRTDLNVVVPSSEEADQGADNRLVC